MANIRFYPSQLSLLVEGRLTAPRFASEKAPLADVLEKLPPTEHKPSWWAAGFRNLVVGIAAAIGATSLPTGMFLLHRAAATRAEKPVATESVTGTVLTGLAKADALSREYKTVRFAEDAVTAWYAFQMAALSIVALKRLRKKTMRPDAIWAPLNAAGYTGKGLTVGVVGTGYVPTEALPPERVRYFKVENLQWAMQPDSEDDHESFVANLIAQACPESRFVMVAADNPEHVKYVEQAIQRYFGDAMDDPKKLTLAGLRKLMAPWIQDAADAVRKAVDEGADVVNLSYCFGQSVRLFLADYSARSERISKEHKEELERLAEIRGNVVTPHQQKMADEMNRHDRLVLRIKMLLKSEEETESVTQDLVDLYKPWHDTLDYAYQRGVPVILSAGNDGGHNAKDGNLMGHINLLACKAHPALKVVASANAEGQLSGFTSEYNDLIHPQLAANGSGELDHDLVATPRAMIRRIGMPFEQQTYWLTERGMEGTSFAAPDLTTLYVKMKDIDPDLTMREAFEIIEKTATQAFLGKAQLGQERDFLERHGLPADEESFRQHVEAEIKRRAGHGMISRYAAIREAARRKLEKHPSS